jgi:hypothetical protein
MSPTVRNVLAVIAGAVVGAIVNGALITISPMVVPPPEGVDVTSPESIAAGMHLFETRHFVMPFLAHALGTLAGAFTAYRLASTHKAQMAFVVGALFLVGGIWAATMIPAPTWFIALDLIGAYLPMAWLATRLGGPRVKAV